MLCAHGARRQSSLDRPLYCRTVKNTRRSFLKVAGTAGIGFLGLRRAYTGGRPDPRRATGRGDLGPLVPDPDGILDLPDGFSYVMMSPVGESMDDGLVVPGAHDGMAAFERPDGLIALVRNHELLPGVRGGPFGEGNALLDGFDASKLYDAGQGEVTCLGGTTTVLYDREAGELAAHYLSLAGTVRNCAGGPTPWDTWITCEEAPVLAVGPFAKKHGYNFEVPAFLEDLADPSPIVAMGRFNHEAVAVDRASGVVYQTEDQIDSLIYRYIPDVPGELAQGGKLQALAFADADSLDTRNYHDLTVLPVGEEFPVRWVELDDVDTDLDDLRHRGFLRGAARFARGEGMWAAGGAIYFACTSGGRSQAGQVWRYVPAPDEAEDPQEGGTLTLLVEPNDPGRLDMCDNLTVAPWGDVLLCEDGSGENFLVGVTQDGECYSLARNALNASELAGACFSPDGSTLFFNRQTPGVTFAVTGPWPGA